MNDPPLVKRQPERVAELESGEVKTVKFYEFYTFFGEYFSFLTSLVYSGNIIFVFTDFFDLINKKFQFISQKIVSFFSSFSLFIFHLNLNFQRDTFRDGGSFGSRDFLVTIFLTYFTLNRIRFLVKLFLFVLVSDIFCTTFFSLTNKAINRMNFK